MLGDFVEDDGSEQVWAEEAARCGMEGCGRLTDAAALLAGKPLPHGLDHLEATRDLRLRIGGGRTGFDKRSLQQ